MQKGKSAGTWCQAGSSVKKGKIARCRKKVDMSAMHEVANQPDHRGEHGDALVGGGEVTSDVALSRADNGDLVVRGRNVLGVLAAHVACEEVSQRTQTNERRILTRRTVVAGHKRLNATNGLAISIEDTRTASLGVAVEDSTADVGVGLPEQLGKVTSHTAGRNSRVVGVLHAGREVVAGHNVVVVFTVVEGLADEGTGVVVVLSASGDKVVHVAASGPVARAVLVGVSPDAGR